MSGQDIVDALLYVIPVGLGWYWWDCYKSGTVYYRRWFNRRDDPFNYWFVMVTLAVLVAFAAAGVTALTFNLEL